MHCSSFEPLLDPFAVGTLTLAERTNVEAHVTACSSCAELLAEIRVLDALLVTPAVTELPPNFTFKVMAEVRSMTKPHVARTSLFRVLGAYLAFAWMAIAAFAIAGGEGTKQAASLLRGSLGQAGDVFAAVSAAISRLCDHDALGVGMTMSAILALDALATFAAVAVYGILLQRFAPARVAVRDGFDS